MLDAGKLQPGGLPEINMINSGIVELGTLRRGLDTFRWHHRLMCLERSCDIRVGSGAQCPLSSIINYHATSPPAELLGCWTDEDDGASLF